MKSALILTGGWEGHQPSQLADRLTAELEPLGFKAVSQTSLEVLDDAEALRSWDIIIPNWTMGALTKEQSANFTGAVHGGVPLAGMHGGAGDAFRGDLNYEWMMGGHFVGHPHVGDYTVRFIDRVSPITAGLPAEFAYHSEQYYLLVDPGIEVLAETDYLYEGRVCRMPVAWTKQWGRGRIFYTALGHTPAEFDQFPVVLDLFLRGIRWAAGLL
ncbi:MAG: ThuA domain-containing protein [Chthoniobacterales bacterium]